MRDESHLADEKVDEEEPKKICKQIQQMLEKAVEVLTQNGPTKTKELKTIQGVLQHLQKRPAWRYLRAFSGATNNSSPNNATKGIIKLLDVAELFVKKSPNPKTHRDLLVELRKSLGFLYGHFGCTGVEAVKCLLYDAAQTLVEKNTIKKQNDIERIRKRIQNFLKDPSCIKERLTVEINALVALRTGAVHPNISKSRAIFDTAEYFVKNSSDSFMQRALQKKIEACLKLWQS